MKSEQRGINDIDPNNRSFTEQSESDIHEPNIPLEHHGKLKDPGKQLRLFGNRASSVTCPTRSLQACPRDFRELIPPLFSNSIQSTLLPVPILRPQIVRALTEDHGRAQQEEMQPPPGCA